MYAVKIGTNVDIDDPIASSGGANPDVIFSHNGKRIAVACKTLHSGSANAVRDNLKSAAKQIIRAECDFGYIAINSMNILPHEQLSQSVFGNVEEPADILSNFIIKLYGELKSNAIIELKEIFSNEKVRPIILTFIHSTTRISSSIGNLPTMLKKTCAVEMIDNASISEDFKILDKVNDFIHNRL